MSQPVTPAELHALARTFRSMSRVAAEGLPDDEFMQGASAAYASAAIAVVMLSAVGRADDVEVPLPVRRTEEGTESDIDRATRLT